MTGDKKGCLRMSTHLSTFSLFFLSPHSRWKNRNFFYSLFSFFFFFARDLSTSLFGKGEVTRLPLAYFSPFSSSSSSPPPGGGGGGGGKRRRRQEAPRRAVRYFPPPSSFSLSKPNALLPRAFFLMPICCWEEILLFRAC